MIFIICLLMTSAVFSQTKNSKNFCGFDIDNTLKKKDPAYVKQMQIFEQHLQQKIKNNQLSKKAEELLIIPIVFHIFHTGEPIGTGANVSDADVMSLLNRVNDFYRGRKDGTILDTNIEFRLVKRDPNCQSTTGIVRHDFSGNAAYVQFGYGAGQNGATVAEIAEVLWPGTDYFNYSIFSKVNGGSGPQGAGNPINDRKGTTYTTISNSFGDAEKTPEHEIGHSLHLYHPFQGDGAAAGGGTSTHCPSDLIVGDNSDGCADTEICVNDNNNLVDQSINHCTGQPWLNDYTNQNIMNYFGGQLLLTPNQKARARGVVDLSNLTRGNALKSSVTFSPPTAAIFTPNPAARVSGQRGVLSVELNGFKTTSIAAFLEEYLDLSQNCNSYYVVDGSTSHTLKVELPLPPNTNSGHQLGVYIDWNNDGDFEDDNEFQFYKDEINSADGSNNPVVEVPIIYPVNVINSSNVRMRIISDIQRNYNPNGHIDDTNKAAPGHYQPYEGQTEDYMVKIDQTLSLKDFGFENITVFSDNTNKQIRIEGHFETPTNVLVYNIQGRILVSERLNISSSKNNIKTNTLSAGIYIVKIESGQKIKTKKIIIN